MFPLNDAPIRFARVVRPTLPARSVAPITATECGRNMGSRESGPASCASRSGTEGFAAVGSAFTSTLSSPTAIFSIMAARLSGVSIPNSQDRACGMRNDLVRRRALKMRGRAQMCSSLAQTENDQVRAFFPRHLEDLLCGVAFANDGFGGAPHFGARGQQFVQLENRVGNEILLLSFAERSGGRLH